MLLESCTGGQKASEISWDPEIVGYNPRKRPERAEITSFADAARVVDRRSLGIEIRPRPKNHGQ